MDAWTAGNPKARRTGGEWSDLAYLKRRLEAVKVYGAATPSFYADPVGLKPDWLPYLSGMLTAEGHFGLASGGNGLVRPRMRVNLRADDAPLLIELAQRFGVGRTYTYPARHYDRAPTSNWTVFSRRDLVALVTLLDQVPPKGRKGREYDIWREAVLTLRSGQQPDESVLNELAMRLKAERAY